jgi:hypothetical protein
MTFAERMTGRQYIAKQVHPWGIITFPLLVALVIASALCVNFLAYDALAFIAFLFFVVIGLRLWAGLQVACPHCKHKFSSIGLKDTVFLRGAPDSIKRCSACDANLDEELTANNSIEATPDGAPHG